LAIGHFTVRFLNNFLTNFSGLSGVTGGNISFSAPAMNVDGSGRGMTLTVFLALSILGMDFLLYALFQWTYGERHRKRARSRIARSGSISSLSARRCDVHQNARREDASHDKFGGQDVTHQSIQNISRTR